MEIMGKHDFINLFDPNGIPRHNLQTTRSFLPNELQYELFPVWIRNQYHLPKKESTASSARGAGFPKTIERSIMASACAVPWLESLVVGQYIELPDSSVSKRFREPQTANRTVFVVIERTECHIQRTAVKAGHVCAGDTGESLLVLFTVLLGDELDDDMLADLRALPHFDKNLH
jgi:hypothetical protein